MQMELTLIWAPNYGNIIKIFWSSVIIKQSRSVTTKTDEISFRIILDKETAVYHELYTLHKYIFVRM